MALAVVAAVIILIAFMRCSFLGGGICSFIAGDADMAWNPAVLDHNPFLAKLVFLGEDPARQYLTGALLGNGPDIWPAIDERPGLTNGV
jgi:hypothetical protein